MEIAYICIITAFTGWVIIGRAPAILHAPLSAACTFLHGIVTVAGLYILLNATSPVEQIVGFFVVLLGAANAVGGYAVSARMLAMFRVSGTQGIFAFRETSKPRAERRGRPRPLRPKKN
jgi:NAD(P) transhydrogenase subunit alpha